VGGTALVAGHDYRGYNRRIRDAFQAEGWRCGEVDTAFPAFDASLRGRLLYRALPERLGLRGPLRRAGARARIDFVAQVLDRDWDLLLVIRPDLLGPEELAAIRRGRPGAVLACWLMDPIGRYPSCRTVLPLFDRVFLYDRGDLEEGRRINPRTEVLLLAFDPADYAPPTTPAQPLWDLSFIGSPSPDRLRSLEQVCRAADLPPERVRFVVGDWRFLPLLGRRLAARRSWLIRHEYLDFRTLDHPAIRQIYHRSVICLNAHQQGTLQGYNMRVFEVAGAGGGAQLVERLPGLGEQLQEEHEVVCYGDGDELVEQARRLLADHRRARELGARAAIRAAGEHTYRHRVRTLLEACGR